MSHELRTPLNAILGFTRLMARTPDVSSQQEEMLDIIDRSGEHLLGMVNDVLSLARIEAGRIELNEEVFELAQLLQDIGWMMRSRAEGKGLRFDLELATNLPRYLRGGRRQAAPDTDQPRGQRGSLYGSGTRVTARPVASSGE